MQNLNPTTAEKSNLNSTENSKIHCGKLDSNNSWQQNIKKKFLSAIIIIMLSLLIQNVHWTGRYFMISAADED